MRTFRFVLAGLISCLAIYLFVSAPPPLAEGVAASETARVVEVEKMFNAANKINEAARTIYTKQIVGAGKKAGLKFGEDWAEPGIEKGPLPALFLRLAAQKMEAKPPPLGLYLGSDEPINKSNLFTGDQMASFARLKETKAAVFSQVDAIGKIAMYPDLASAEACVTCHNEHVESPKTDWKLNDVMGATTWTYPHSVVAPGEYLAVTEALFQSIEEAYSSYLEKVRHFDKHVPIGEGWPSDGMPVLPSAEVFMAEVRKASAEHVVTELVMISEEKRVLIAEGGQ